MADDWFRSAGWNARAQEEFEQRLRRARPFNRSQYLRIKALALMAHGGKAEGCGARELLVRLIDSYPESGDVVMAHEHPASSMFAMGIEPRLKITTEQRCASRPRGTSMETLRSACLNS